MLRCCHCLFAVLLVLGLNFTLLAQDPIVPAGAKVELLFESHGLTEGCTVKFTGSPPRKHPGGATPASVVSCAIEEAGRGPTRRGRSTSHS